MQHSSQVRLELDHRAQLHSAKWQHDLRGQCEGLLAEQDLVLQKMELNRNDYEPPAICMSAAALGDTDLHVGQRQWELPEVVSPARF